MKMLLDFYKCSQFFLLFCSLYKSFYEFKVLKEKTSLLKNNKVCMIVWWMNNGPDGTWTYKCVLWCMYVRIVYEYSFVCLIKCNLQLCCWFSNKCNRIESIVYTSLNSPNKYKVLKEYNPTYNTIQKNLHNFCYNPFKQPVFRIIFHHIYHTLLMPHLLLSIIIKRWLLVLTMECICAYSKLVMISWQ